MRVRACCVDGWVVTLEYLGPQGPGKRPQCQPWAAYLRTSMYERKIFSHLGYHYFGSQFFAAEPNSN